MFLEMKREKSKIKKCKMMMSTKKLLETMAYHKSKRFKRPSQ